MCFIIFAGTGKSTQLDPVYIQTNKGEHIKIKLRLILQENSCTMHTNVSFYSGNGNASECLVRGGDWNPIFIDGTVTMEGPQELVEALMHRTFRAESNDYSCEAFKLTIEEAQMLTEALDLRHVSSSGSALEQELAKIELTQNADAIQNLFLSIEGQSGKGEDEGDSSAFAA